MINQVSIKQLESYLWGAATLLRGTIDAGDYKQFIFPLLFYKRLCDVYDEETQLALKESDGDSNFAAFRENHRFQIPPEAHWREIRQVARDVGQALQFAMRSIETANPDKLFGIFGDAQWTNKDRLPDSMLRDLVEHFSKIELTLSNLPEDELGNGYEYLIKKFADDSGHTAAEFYTNRTVVHLMTELLQPQPGESIYDPTCGSGGMLISCIVQLHRQGKEWRNAHLYGQERNLMTSSIARMNCFLHGIEDFRIERGDTLSEPKFVQGDRLQQFDLILANPPYSIKQWDRTAFANDPWGRNLYGTPPQGRADYAFWQHILCSLKPNTGRCAILFPHGVLFRQEETEMREKMIKADIIECIIGLGPNLFYNAPMEACIVICQTAKLKERRGKILFIKAVNEVTRERAQSFLTDDHVEHIASTYKTFANELGFSRVVNMDLIKKQSWSLSLPLYIASDSSDIGMKAKETDSIEASINGWLNSRKEFTKALKEILPDLKLPDTNCDLHFSDTFEFLKGTDDWKRVKFGDFVSCLKETVDPNSGKIERYVAGEHMDSENVHISRWGKVGDGYLGPAFIRRFRKGQVLYGSRRTYLKKVAYAEFDGVTSNTTLVLQGIEGKFYQPLLPWIMLSQRFTEHSMRESKGSTNPYINWPDIAKYEFDLPPLDQQRRIAEILWEMDESLKQYECLTHSMQSVFNLKIDQLYGFNEAKQGSTSDWFKPVRLGDLSDIRLSGVDKKTYASEKTVKLCNYLDVYRNRYITADIPFMSASANYSEINRFELKSGDVLITKDSEEPTDIAVPSVVLSDINGVICGYHLALIRPNKDIVDPIFLMFLFTSTHAKNYFASRANGVTRYGLGINDIREFQFLLPSLKSQTEFTRQLIGYEQAIKIIQNHCVKTNTMML